MTATAFWREGYGDFIADVHTGGLVSIARGRSCLLRTKALTSSAALVADDGGYPSESDLQQRDLPADGARHDCAPASDEDACLSEEEVSHSSALSPGFLFSTPSAASSQDADEYASYLLSEEAI